MGTVALITGGVRSGKSAWALSTAEECGLTPRTFVAPAEVLDDEMRERARAHQSERGGSWTTIEEPVALAQVIQQLPAGGVCLIDCLTVWLGNVWHHRGDTDDALSGAVDELVAALTRWRQNTPGRIILVTNEVGWGIVPVEPAVRRYRDWSGRLNQRVAALADEVYLSVAGIAMRVEK